MIKCPVHLKPLNQITNQYLQPLTVKYSCGCEVKFKKDEKVSHKSGTNKVWESDWQLVQFT